MCKCKCKCRFNELAGEDLELDLGEFRKLLEALKGDAAARQ